MEDACLSSVRRISLSPLQVCTVSCDASFLTLPPKNLPHRKGHRAPAPGATFALLSNASPADMGTAASVHCCVLADGTILCTSGTQDIHHARTQFDCISFSGLKQQGFPLPANSSKRYSGFRIQLMPFALLRSISHLSF